MTIKDLIPWNRGREVTENKDRRFSERFYGHFERRIPVNEIDEGKVSA